MTGEALPLPLFTGLAEAPTPPPNLAPGRDGQEPGISPDRDGLRAYQREAVGRILDELDERRSTLLVMATGLGKTQVFSTIARYWRGRVLVLAHRSELLEQARNRLEQMAGERVGLEQADEYAGGERIVVGSVQTMCQQRRLGRFAGAPFALVIVDEAHHTSAVSYRRILDAFGAARVLGVTATPDRGDGQALGEIFESVAYVRDIEAGIDDGYLVPVAVRQVVLEQVDLSAVRTTAGDLNIGDLDVEMQKGNEAVAQKCLELCGQRRTIVFSTKVATAHDLVATFNRVAEEDVARAVDGETPWEERRNLLAAHARGEYQFLVNVGIATEGYDCPDVSCVAIARPTKSRALYTQMAGRGLRVLPGLVEGEQHQDARRALLASSRKPDCLLLDFSGNAGRHKLVSPIDILGGRLADVPDDMRADVKKRAEELARNGTVDADKALKQARAEIEAERRRRAEDIRRLQSRVQASVYDVDPFGGGGRQDPGVPGGKVPPTEKQRYRLLAWGYRKDEVARMSRTEASHAIGREIDRLNQGLCSRKQAQLLKRCGVAQAESLTRQVASNLISALVDNHYRPIDRDRMAGIIGGRQPGAEG